MWYFRVAWVLWVGILSAWCTVSAATDRFEQEVRGLETAAQKAPVAQGGILLYGSSSFRLWTDVDRRFPEHCIVNNGFGGSQLSDLNHFFDRLVVPAAPKVLLVYGGDNDIAGAKTPQRVLEDFRQLVEQAKRKIPGIRIAFLAIKPSPSRASMLSAQAEANRLIAKFAKRHRHVDFLDVATPLMDGQGQPDPAYFTQDRLHLNPLGYDRWVEVIGPYLKRHAPPMGS